MNNMSFFKGIGLGVMVGSVVGMITAPKKQKASRIGKAIRSVGDAVENIAGGIGLG